MSKILRVYAAAALAFTVIWVLCNRYNAARLPASGAVCAANIEMVRVDGGTFTMGCTEEQGEECGDNEKPAHSVTVSDFYIGRYEVTRWQWRRIFLFDLSAYHERFDLPVHCVSWNETQRFIKRLNKVTGRRYRLPTEAEWEYAARGGNMSGGYRYSGGGDINEVGWFGFNSGDRPRPVGTKQPNELGILDMTGNVSEWMGDRYGAYDSVSQTDPTGLRSGSRRVTRGGDLFYDEAKDCRVSTRDWVSQGEYYANVGFRLAHDADYDGAGQSADLAKKTNAVIALAGGVLDSAGMLALRECVNVWTTVGMGVLWLVYIIKVFITVCWVFAVPAYLINYALQKRKKRRDSETALT